MDKRDVTMPLPRHTAYVLEVRFYQNGIYLGREMLTAICSDLNQLRKDLLTRECNNKKGGESSGFLK